MRSKSIYNIAYVEFTEQRGPLGGRFAGEWYRHKKYSQNIWQTSEYCHILHSCRRKIENWGICRQQLHMKKRQQKQVIYLQLSNRSARVDSAFGSRYSAVKIRTGKVNMNLSVLWLNTSIILFSETKFRSCVNRKLALNQSLSAQPSRQSFPKWTGARFWPSARKTQ